MVAAIIGRAAFFAPLISTVPFKRLPPLMMSLSRFSPLRKVYLKKSIYHREHRENTMIN